MRKYKVTAEIAEVVDESTVRLSDDNIVENIILANDEWDARNKFFDAIEYVYGKVEIYNIHCEDIGPSDTYLFGVFDSYKPNKSTITVGELIKILEDFDPDSKLYLVNNQGLFTTYGVLKDTSVYEEGDDSVNPY